MRCSYEVKHYSKGTHECSCWIYNSCAFVSHCYFPWILYGYHLFQEHLRKLVHGLREYIKDQSKKPVMIALGKLALVMKVNSIKWHR